VVPELWIDHKRSFTGMYCRDAGTGLFEEWLLAWLDQKSLLVVTFILQLTFNGGMLNAWKMPDFCNLVAPIDTVKILTL